jgi:hypothetical protein
MYLLLCSYFKIKLISRSSRACEFVENRIAAKDAGEIGG